MLATGLLALVGVSIPALMGIARAARSAEKLFDTLDRELPRTLEALRHTGNDLRDLADDMTDGVSSARNIVKQVDRSLSDARHQANQAQRTTRSAYAGLRAAWRVLTRTRSTSRNRRPATPSSRYRKKSQMPSHEPVSKAPPPDKENGPLLGKQAKPH